MFDRVVRTLILLVVASLPLAQVADAHSDDVRGAPPALSDLAERIAGGASLLADSARGRAFDDVHRAAHEFEKLAHRRNASSGDLARAWRDLDESVRRLRAGGNGRNDFLVTHLREDVEAAGRFVDLDARGSTDVPASSPGRHELVTSETCVGTGTTRTRPCPRPTTELRFRVPRDLATIDGISAVWRDHGRPAKALVYLDDRLVWETDVAEDWDPDRTRVDLAVRRGSVLTVRSSTGDPIWIRSLELTGTVDAGAAGGERRPWWLDALGL